MNYYEHHIGDYDEATAHLTACEDGIYSRLIRKYYSTERPLPNDIPALQRLVRARTREEKSAVVAMLEEFFVLCDDGWHQSRCDEDLQKYQDGEPEREIRKVNEGNRLKRHREERSRLFKVLTDAGEHAPWNIGMNELRAIAARISGSSTETGLSPLPETAPETPATATQSPVTKHQTPIKNIDDQVVSGTPSRDTDDDFRPKDAAEWLSHFKRKHGFEADPTNVNDRKKLWPVFAAWSNAGLTTKFVDAAVAAAQQRAREPIACLPLYVDRLMASEQAARANPQRTTRSYHDERADTIAGLTGRNRHESDDERTIDVPATAVARLAG